MATKPRVFRWPGTKSGRRKKDPRPSASARGYDSRWQRLRDWYIKKHPLCELCLGRGKTTAATQVHHIRPIAQHPELRLRVDNLQALCDKCHGEVHGGGAV